MDGEAVETVDAGRRQERDQAMIHLDVGVDFPDPADADGCADAHVKRKRVIVRNILGTVMHDVFIELIQGQKSDPISGFVV